jgi:hypothetical protein
MVGGVGVYRLKHIGIYEDGTDILGGFWRESCSFSGMTAAEPYAAEKAY